jgi:hypothetical protein
VFELVYQYCLHLLSERSLSVYTALHLHVVCSRQMVCSTRPVAYSCSIFVTGATFQAQQSSSSCSAPFSLLVVANHIVCLARSVCLYACPSAFVFSSCCDVLQLVVIS